MASSELSVYLTAKLNCIVAFSNSSNAAVQISVGMVNKFNAYCDPILTKVGDCEPKSSLSPGGSLSVLIHPQDKVQLFMASFNYSKRVYFLFGNGKLVFLSPSDALLPPEKLRELFEVLVSENFVP
jgi:hypothetical protein